MVTVLKKGSYFGEIGLLRTCRRTASIRAISETVDLFVLSKVPCSFSRAIFEFVICSTASERGAHYHSCSSRGVRSTSSNRSLAEGFSRLRS